MKCLENNQFSNQETSKFQSRYWQYKYILLSHREKCKYSKTLIYDHKEKSFFFTTSTKLMRETKNST